MPTTRKQKKRARKSREADMLSDIENLDIRLGGNRLEWEESEFSNSVRKPENLSYNALANHDVNSHSNSRDDEIWSYVGNGQNSREVDCSSEMNRLSGKLNQRITQEMKDFVSNVSSQTQRAINEQVLPQIQATLRSEPGQVPNRRSRVEGMSRVEDRNVDLKKP